MPHLKIAIVGIGGVGGYFGGLLARKYYGSTQIEICFLARGAHLQAIQQNGLCVIKGDTSFTAFPAIATHNAADIVNANMVVICTKSYDLESVIEQIKPCVNNDTLILPLLNGVSSVEKIKQHFPENTVLKGCVYIVSRLKQPGIIENSGNIQKLFFELADGRSEALMQYEAVFREAGIEANCTSDISSVVWEKFVFLSPIATITSCYNKCIGEILAAPETEARLHLLINEIIGLAKAKGIPFDEKTGEKTFGKIRSLPFESTTSMHTDFVKHKTKTEIETLTNYVIEEGKKHNIPTPTYLQMYEQLIRL
ncbi:MAG: ketopantoate reductase family protein [Bacteroidetes bacterium]|nr:ketopantoate reductase family protein [Bacteroidota bacterium]